MKSNLEWKKWGEIDPLYGVASWKDKAKGGKTPWQDKDFYELGKSDWLDFKKHWEQYGFDHGRCLEIGCGVGRITMHLAADFKAVVALDVSDDMLRYARERIRDKHVEFILSDGDRLPVRDDSVTSVFSTHVFQHFNSLKEATGIFKEVYRVLGKSGTLMIHLPIYRWPFRSLFFSWPYYLWMKIDGLKAGFIRFLIMRGNWRPLMMELHYELDWLYRTLDGLGFADIELRMIRVRSNNDPHSFIFARKQKR